MRRIRAWSMALAVATATALPGGAAQAAPEGPVTVYVDPTGPAALHGGQQRDGSAPERAVGSVAAAESVLRARGARDARVLLRGGVHHLTSPIRWSYAPRGGRVTFSTIPGTGAVVLDGSRMRSAAVPTSATGDDVGTAAAGYGMTLTSADSGVVVEGYTFQYFRNGGIRVAGKPGDRAGDIVIRGNTFQYLGDHYNANGTGTGYGGVHVTNSTGTRIEGNRFYYLANDDSPAAIHGVYLANYSNSSTIAGNRFGYVTGDPIRTRHNSKYNVADGNMFWRAGAYAIMSDWRFDSEDCGVGNVFKNNKVGDTSYNGDAWNEDPQGGIDPVRVRLWGHDDAKNANLGGCASDPVTFGGGNVYVSTRPW
ncbi:right-handed parallel beta-helix repeat-containing protein [Micromonospora sp. WMMD1128]|uniref:right-handed parallel beta-helix repeat-containing protein n=1 Tax=unclassified Micromonospora TaxID=2617518 RepID=UPI00248AFE0A|nr:MULTISPECIES: right-handed parallel beta-helix repeat-containing protein [unclassified Micromonospora]WBB71241.1 right-handed parallel beta-helix repeat-containing protein [Micromonospora sp. WMMD1128]WFE35285.1 right-handed parallel beta-helix repeat-containing protein [Micromonospora sp. WMMD975]